MGGPVRCGYSAKMRDYVGHAVFDGRIQAEPSLGTEDGYTVRASLGRAAPTIQLLESTMLDHMIMQRGIRHLSDDEIVARTGRCWHEWWAVLDVWDGDKHQLLATIAYLKAQYGLNQYWARLIGTY